jgi:hypothetical protein
MYQPMLQTMKQYNEAIESYHRAEEYFNRTDIIVETKQLRALDCQILVNHLAGLVDKIKDLGYVMTDEEILSGFRQVKFLGL